MNTRAMSDDSEQGHKDLRFNGFAHELGELLPLCLASLPYSDLGNATATCKEWGEPEVWREALVASTGDNLAVLGKPGYVLLHACLADRPAQAWSDHEELVCSALQRKVRREYSGYSDDGEESDDERDSEDGSLDEYNKFSAVTHWCYSLVLGRSSGLKQLSCPPDEGDLTKEIWRMTVKDAL